VPKPNKREAIINDLIGSLKAARLRQDLSLNALSANAGIDRTMLSRVEKRERTPTIEVLLRIAEALDINLGKFLLQAIKANGC
jgi:transcriptional regulator with XRE-family HTH domain